MRQMATSPEFGPGKEGIVAAVSFCWKILWYSYTATNFQELQQSVQTRFKKSYEIIVSRSDFVATTYTAGEKFCKFKTKNFVILAYVTPRQYDIDKKDDERILADVSNRDPLGSSETKFPDEEPFHKELQLEESGDRAGYPVGSHCSNDTRTGSKCCNLRLFNAMKDGYDRHKASPNFDRYNIRNISKAIQWSVEEVFQHSAEVFVSLDDFAYATNEKNEESCKYRVDKYYVYVYTTPVPVSFLNNFSTQQKILLPVSNSSTHVQRHRKCKTIPLSSGSQWIRRYGMLQQWPSI